MKKNLTICFAVLAAVACTNENQDGPGTGTGEITIDFSADKETAFAGDEVKFTAEVSGGVAPYTYEWSFSDDITSTDAEPVVVWEEVGVKLVTLNVTDSKGNKAAKPKSKTYAVAAAPIEDKGDISISWYVDFADDGGGVRGSAPAVDDEGNVYITTSVSNAGQLRKVAAGGKSYTSASITNSPSNTCMSPSIDSEGNVYAGGGSGSGGSVHKYSSSLSDLWSAAFWGYNAAANPKIWYGAAVQLDNAVLLANAGTTGTMGAVSKVDGARMTYVTTPDGGGPSGGCRQAPVVSKNGYVWQACAGTGIIGLPLSSLVGSGAVVYDFFAKSDHQNADLSSSNSDRLAQAVVTVDGKDYCAGVASHESGVTTIYLVGQGDGRGTGACEVEAKQFAINETTTSISNSTTQDQGGVIVGARNEVIVNLKAGAVEDGGIVAVDPATMTLAWEYRIAESVSGAPALTKEGNVVFGTDKGSFYIIKPDYTTKKAELVAKADINALIQEAGMSHAAGFENFNIKMWSSVCVGDDGAMYIGFQKNDEVTRSGLLCLKSSAVTGPGNSCWPMFGVDRKHTGVQK